MKRKKNIVDKKDFLAWVKNLKDMPMDELQKQAKELIRYQAREGENIIKRAINKGFITRKEYDKKYKEKFLDRYGNNSFVLLMDAKLNELDVFITNNVTLLKKREEFQKRFNIQIKTVWEMTLEAIEDEKERNKPEYIG